MEDSDCNDNYWVKCHAVKHITNFVTIYGTLDYAGLTEVGKSVDTRSRKFVPPGAKFETATKGGVTVRV